MKSDKLQDAVGMVDADLVERAEKKRQKKGSRFPRWTVPIAAVLVIAIGFGILFGDSYSPFSLRVHAVSEAEYPEMEQYPSVINNLFQDDDYKRWREDQKARRSYYGAGENLDVFIQKTASEILANAGKENRIYSPLNVYMALAMLAEVTYGESRSQILNLLGAGSIEELRTQAHAVWNANYNDDGAYTSILASSLWLNENIDYKKETLDTLAKSYYASSFSGEMGSDKYNQALRAWLNDQTGGLLKEQIDDIEMTPQTVMDIVTTIYFQDKWEQKFSKDKNTTDTFHGAAGDIKTTFFNQRVTYGTYYWGEQFSATQKELKNSGKMYFILPDSGVSIDELLVDEELLSFLTLGDAYENRKDLIVNLSLPEFDVSSKLDLSESLKNLGVTDCFDMETSDFSPLLGSDSPVEVSAVNHGSRVIIDEEGVKAVAYLEIPLAGSAMPPEDEIDFVIDRPFLFVIMGNDNLPLFIGVVNQVG